MMLAVVACLLVISSPRRQGWQEWNCNKWVIYVFDSKKPYILAKIFGFSEVGFISIITINNRSKSVQSICSYLAY